jgi:hypothetical protein
VVKASGAPFGSKKLKKCNPCVLNPIIVIPKNKDNLVLNPPLRPGVAPSLLPLLAEPVRNILSGLSVTARRRHSQQTVALLHAMLPMVAGAADDAGEVRREAVAAALAMNARLSAMEPSHDSSVPYWAERKATANIEEIRQYFADHPSPGRAGTGDGAGSGPLLVRLPLIPSSVSPHPSQHRVDS